MSWRNTEYEDLHRIVLSKDASSMDMRSAIPDTPESRLSLQQNARTWLDGDSILAIAGVAPLWKGVGTVWTLISEEARDRVVGLTRGVLRLMDSDRSYWRLQATVERGDERARLWIILLGFSYEGTMVAYAPDGKTHDMYARVRI